MRLYPVKTPLIVQRTFHSYTWKYDTEEPTVHLTFDDGPTPELTEKILNTLARKGVKATFFCVGENLDKYPEQAQTIASEGHLMANHTYNHLNGWNSPSEHYLANVELCSERLKQFTADQRLFRPPYGRITLVQAKKLMKKGYQIVMWDVLSGDFDPGMSTNNSLRMSLKHSEAGSIVVFHDNIKAREKLDAVLPVYIDEMKLRGYTFRTL